MTRLFNRHVKTSILKVGDLVLRKIEAMSKSIEKRKLGASWDGPFKITQKIKTNTFKLEDLGEKKLKQPWHADHLKKYFI